MQHLYPKKKPKWSGWQQSGRLGEIVSLRLLGSVLVELRLHLGVRPLDRLVLALDTLDPVEVVQGCEHGALLPQNVALEPPGQPGEDLVSHKGAGRDSKDCNDVSDETPQHSSVQDSLDTP